MQYDIHHGYRMKGTVEALATFRAAFRDGGGALARALVTRRLAEIAADTLDHRALGLDLFPARRGEDRDPHAYGRAHEILYRAHEGQRLRDERHPRDNFECTVVAIPRGRHLLLTAYGEQRAYFDFLAALPGLEPYSCWTGDVGDRPDGVSAAEWVARGRAWDAALEPVRGVPSKAGYTIHLLGRHLPHVEPADAVAALPDLATRARRLRKDVLYLHWLTVIAGVDPDAPDAPRGNAAIRLAIDFAEWCQTADGQAALAATEADLRARLPAAYTEDDLLRWPEAAPPRDAGPDAGPAGPR